jgi:hypothetical protein
LDDPALAKLTALLVVRLEHRLNVPNGVVAAFVQQVGRLAHLDGTYCLLPAQPGDPPSVLERDLFLEELSINLVELVGFLLPPACLDVQAALEVLQVFLLGLLLDFLLVLDLLVLVGPQLGQNRLCELVVGRLLLLLAHIKGGSERHQILRDFVVVPMRRRGLLVDAKELLPVSPGMGIDGGGQLGVELEFGLQAAIGLVVPAVVLLLHHDVFDLLAINLQRQVL